MVPHAEDIAWPVDPERYDIPANIVDRLSGKVPGIRDLLADIDFANHAARRVGLPYVPL